VAGETARALRRRLLVVPVAVALVLLTAFRPPGDHAGLVEESCTDAPSAHELKELLDLAGRNPGVVAGPLEDRVAEGDHGVAQAGHQGLLGITAEVPGSQATTRANPWGTRSDGTRSRWSKDASGISQCSTGSNETMWLPRELPGDGAVDAAGGEGPVVDDPAAAVTTEEDGGADPPPG